MLLILFTLGICAMLTSGVIAATLWIAFYGLLVFWSFSMALHWCWHLFTLPAVPSQDADLYRSDTPYHWRYNETGQMNIPSLNGGLYHEAFLQ